MLGCGLHLVPVLLELVSLAPAKLLASAVDAGQLALHIVVGLAEVAQSLLQEGDARAGLHAGVELHEEVVARVG